jgi:hypothetical protein
MSKGKSAKYATFLRDVQKATKDLPKSQQELLFASLFLAWISAAKEEELQNGFSGAFTPEQAALLVKYADGSPLVHSTPRLVDNSIQSSASYFKSIRS